MYTCTHLQLLVLFEHCLVLDRACLGLRLPISCTSCSQSQREGGREDAFLVYMISEDMRSRSHQAASFDDGWWTIVSVCHVSVDDALHDGIHSIMEKFVIGVMCNAKTPALIVVDEVMLTEKRTGAQCEKRLRWSRKPGIYFTRFVVRTIDPTTSLPSTIPHKRLHLAILSPPL
jgi:hypothetical protein